MSDSTDLVATLEDSLAAIDEHGTTIVRKPGEMSFSISMPDGIRVEFHDGPPADLLVFVAYFPDTPDRYPVAYDITQMPMFSTSHRKALLDLAENPMVWILGVIESATRNRSRAA